MKIFEEVSQTVNSWKKVLRNYPRGILSALGKFQVIYLKVDHSQKVRLKLEWDISFYLP